MPLTINFKRERETKNTWRFNEVSDDGVEAIGALYIQKWALKQTFGNVPEALSVSIEEKKS